MRVPERKKWKIQKKRRREGGRSVQRKKLTEAYGTITLAGMTRPARLRSTRGWKLNPDGLLLSAGGPKILGMRKRRRKKRTFEKITCDDDVRIGERGYWHYSWRQTGWTISMNRSYDVADAGIWNNNDIR